MFSSGFVAVTSVLLAASPQFGNCLITSSLRMSSGGDDCPLPVGGRWCTARSNGREWQMAVYAEHDPVSDTICEKGFWEFTDLSAMKVPKQEPGARFLDIGGHIGWYSFLFAAHDFKVLAVEPMTANRDLFKATLCRNPDIAARVDLHAMALSDSAPAGAECKIYTADINNGDGNLACGAKMEQTLMDQAKSRGFNYVLRESVPLGTLDALLTSANVDRIDAVKIDVEDHECFVMKGGANQLFQRYAPRYLKIEVTAKTLNCVFDKVKHGALLANATYRSHKNSFAGPGLSKMGAGNRDDVFFTRTD